MAWGAQVIPPPARLRDRVLGRRRVAQRRWRPQFLVLGCPLTQAMSYVVKGRQRRDRWGAEIWTSDRQRSLTPRKLALLHKVIAAYATEHQTRMQCVAELPVPRCSCRARAPTPLNH